MNRVEENTQERILISALRLFSERGISQTSIDEVAKHAGVTRVTVYRYFTDKKNLAFQAFLRIEQVFQKASAELERNPQADWAIIMKQIGEDLSTLPQCNVVARSDELKRLYPEVYRSIQEVREDTLNRMFDQLFTIAERENLLRPGLNRSIVQAVFWELVVNFFDNPRFKSFGLSDAELYHVMTEIFCHGIFICKPIGNE